jgi:uncharacterized protein (DUF58 family)
MKRVASPRLRAYLVLGAAGLLAGAALGRPEPVILAAPLILAALVGVLTADMPDLAVHARLSVDRILEGEAARLDVELRAAGRVDWLDLVVDLPGGLVAADSGRVLRLRLDAGETRQLTFDVEARRWGSYRLGGVRARILDRFGFIGWEVQVQPEVVLSVYPRPTAVRRAIAPTETHASVGDEVSRRWGAGIEFADVRAYVPGDPVRKINWRISSRRPELHVNDMHPERSTEVVILLDTFTDLAADQVQSSLAAAVRGATGIANHYLRRRDRVGLITFGGSIRWLVPGMGLAQAYRIVAALLDARTVVSFVWKDVGYIAARSLPANALVIAVSPLLDDQFVGALRDLRGRGFDLAVIEMDPEAFIGTPADAFDSVARRIWRLRREETRDRFRRLGVAIATWTPGEPLDPVLEEVRTFRRSAHRASA